MSNETASFQILPNPNNGHFTIVSDLEKDVITIYSSVGQVINQIAVKNGIASINLENLDSGIYILKSVQSQKVERIFIE